jgi:hypothetical protein
MLNLEAPKEGTVRALRQYIKGAWYEDKKTGEMIKIKMEGNKERNLRPPQFREDSAMTTKLRDDDDFVSLHPPGDDDLGTLLVAKCFGWLLTVSPPTMMDVHN